MTLSKIILLIMTSCLITSTSFAQTKKRSVQRRPQNARATRAKRPAKKSFAQKNYKEIQIGLSQVTDKFDIDANGTKGTMRSQLNGVNLLYSLYRPARNTKWLYSYGFGAALGFAKGIAVGMDQITPLGQEAKNKLWFAGSFVPGIDFRHSYRARVGVFAPLTFRALDFGFEDDVKVSANDPFAIGIGARYVNAVSIRQSVSFSFTHHITWQSSQWDLTWQYRLGL